MKCKASLGPETCGRDGDLANPRKEALCACGCSEPMCRLPACLPSAWRRWGGESRGFFVVAVREVDPPVACYKRALLRGSLYARVYTAEMYTAGERARQSGSADKAEHPRQGHAASSRAALRKCDWLVPGASALFALCVSASAHPRVTQVRLGFTHHVGCARAARDFGM